MNSYLFLLILYSGLLILIGLWIGRRVKSSETFFVAGRRLGPLLVFSTLLAANIGAGSTVGAAGLGYRDGLSAWWWVGSAGIGSVILGLWLGPRLWEIAARFDLRTLGDYLEHRYSSSVRGFVAALLWLATLALLAAQLIAVSRLLEVVAGVPKVAGCLMGGLVMTTYFAAGGLLTSAWVNLVQLVVLLSGFLIALPVLLSSVGGLQGLFASAAAGNPDSVNFWQSGESGWIYLALLAPAFIISPGLIQKIYGARDGRTIRLAVTLQGVVLMIFAFVPPLLGMIAAHLHPDLGHHELALPTVLLNDLPWILGAIGLAAVFSAEISSADAILFMLATSLSRDLYQRFIDPEADDSRVLRVARLAAAAGGISGVILAIVLADVIESMKIFYALLTVSLFVPVVAGIWFRRAGAPEAWAAIGCGTLVLVSTRLWSGADGFLGLTPGMAGLAAAALGFAGVMIARLRPSASLRT